MVEGLSPRAVLFENVPDLALGDDAILNTAYLSRFLAEHQPGERVTVTYYRGQEELHGEIELGSRPE